MKRKTSCEDSVLTFLELVAGLGFESSVPAFRFPLEAAVLAGVVRPGAAFAALAGVDSTGSSFGPSLCLGARTGEELSSLSRSF